MNKTLEDICKDADEIARAIHKNSPSTYTAKNMIHIFSLVKSLKQYDELLGKTNKAVEQQNYVMQY